MFKPLYFLLLVFVLTSCLSHRKQVYFNSDEFVLNTPVLKENSPPQYKLEPDDVLSIKVQSLDPEVSNFFNIDNTSIQRIGNDPASLFLTGYSIDENGFITLPTIGQLKVSGLTVYETQELVQRTIDEYLKNAIVLVKLVSFKISVIGEVNQPGYFYIYNNQANLPEALALAGDLSDFGNRENIKLIRQTPGGPEVTLLDLTDPDLLSSPYYYLMPNDVIYVEPVKASASRSNLTPLNIFIGAISTVIAILVTLDLVK